MNNSQRPVTPSPAPSNRPGTGSGLTKPKTSASGQFFRALLRWITAIAFVFCLGVLAVWFVRVRPESEQISQMETKIFTLQKELNGPQPQVQILQSLLEVSQAQVALAQGDTAGVPQALSGTDSRLAQSACDCGNGCGWGCMIGCFVEILPS